MATAVWFHFLPGNNWIIVEELRFRFVTFSSGLGYRDPFRSICERTQSPNFSFPHEEYPSYNQLFTRAKFQKNLNLCENVAPEPDGISYQMMRHIHATASAFLLFLYNCIKVKKLHPVLQTSIPISKSGKDPFIADNQRPLSLTYDTCEQM